MMGAADVWFQLHGLSGMYLTFLFRHPMMVLVLMNCFFFLVGDSVTDKEGGKWHGNSTGAFLFRYAKDENTIKLKSTQIFSDSSPALKMMLQNGLLDAETLKGIVIGS